MTLGAELEIPYKEKTGEHLRSCGRDEFIYQFREITLGRKTVKIAVSKAYGAEYYGIKPLKFVIE